MSYFHRRHYTWELIHGSIQSIFLKENLCPFKDDLILKNPIYDIEWKTNRHTNMIQTQRHKVWNLQVYFHSDVDVKCQNDWWKYLAACEYLSPLLFFNVVLAFLPELIVHDLYRVNCMLLYIAELKNRVSCGNLFFDFEPYHLMGLICGIYDWNQRVLFSSIVLSIY